MIEVTHNVPTPFAPGQLVLWEDLDGGEHFGSFVGPCAEPQHYPRCAWVALGAGWHVAVAIEDLRAVFARGAA